MINKIMKKEEVKIRFVSSLFLAVILLTLFIVFTPALVSSQTSDSENITKITREDAELALENIRKIMKEMSESNFSIERINDTLKKAEQMYSAQKILESKGRKADYSLILLYEKDVEIMGGKAFQARDELFSLEQSLEPLRKRKINITEADFLVEKIRQEINDERYEKALEIIPNTRNRIAEIEASATAIKVFYGATKRTILDFLRDNYIALTSVIIFSLIIYFVYRRKVAVYLIKKKIKNLDLEKATIKKLIQKTQEDYFEKGKISEGNYTIRVKKFGELIRDIDRRVPLLVEQLEAVKKK
jgi:hypothetical protein